MRKVVLLNGKEIHSFDELLIGEKLLCISTLMDESDLPDKETVTLSRHELLRFVKYLLTISHKIPAIKLVRSYTGWGLREAQLFVNSLEQNTEKKYRCELFYDKHWHDYVDQTLEQAIKLFNTHVSVMLDNTVLWNGCGKYGVTLSGGTKMGVDTRQEAIGCFRRLFLSRKEN